MPEPINWVGFTGGIDDALDRLADELCPPDQSTPNMTAVVHVEVDLRNIAEWIRGRPRHPNGHLMLTTTRIDNATHALERMVQAGFALQAFGLGPMPPMESPESDLRMWRTIVECVLRADGKYRHTHPGELE
jgi:hypothetical protein